MEKNRKAFQQFDWKRKVTECDFVVFDTELTGLNRRKDEIISIGAVRVRNLKIELGHTFDEHVQPKNIDHTDATLIHRITPEQLRQARSLEEVLSDFIEFVGDSVLVGHYVSLDTSFVDRATRTIFGKKLANPAIDTMLMAHAYKKMLFENFDDEMAMSQKYHLSDLSKDFDLPSFQSHNGFEDALQTAYLFLFLVKKLKISALRQEKPVETVKDLFKVGKVKDR